MNTLLLKCKSTVPRLPGIVLRFYAGTGMLKRGHGCSHPLADLNQAGLLACSMAGSSQSCPRFLAVVLRRVAAFCFPSWTLWQALHSAARFSRFLFRGSWSRCAMVRCLANNVGHFVRHH